MHFTPLADKATIAEHRGLLALVMQVFPIYFLDFSTTAKAVALSAMSASLRRYCENTTTAAALQRALYPEEFGSIKASIKSIRHSFFTMGIGDGKKDPRK